MILPQCSMKSITDKIFNPYRTEQRECRCLICMAVAMGVDGKVLAGFSTKLSTSRTINATDPTANMIVFIANATRRT